MQLKYASYQPAVAGQDMGAPRSKAAGTAALVSAVQRRRDTCRRADRVGPAVPSRCTGPAGLLTAQPRAACRTGGGGRRERSSRRPESGKKGPRV
jgi:hypothetical protein